MSRTRTDPAADGTLALWEYAGLLLTYWCNARCAFCYVYSGPDRGGALSTADALELWAGLDRLAARGARPMRVHLAGGEPFGDWPRLVSIIRAGRDAGRTPLDAVETNAFWATADGLTRARLELLAGLGVRRLVISADVYHQEYVPVERVQRCVNIARDVFGPGRIRVRWWDSLNQPVDLRRASPAARRAAYAAAMERHKDRLTGRAAELLADFFPLRPAEAFAEERCTAEVLHSRHVHVDPGGNVFPGVCNGIILGNALRDGGVEAVWDRLAATWADHPVVGEVVRGGSFALYRRARALGYAPRTGGYANKCHLCMHVRQFLVDRGGWERWVGPPEAYALPSDRRDEMRLHGRVALPVCP